jgi:Predicted pyridoxal phosphate-dependent enzyme apparently involved in regulation of cell wall biogenesis
LHRNKYYQHLATDEQMPGSMTFFNRLLRLPIYPTLTMRERESVIKAVKKVLIS